MPKYRHLPAAPAGGRCGALPGTRAPEGPPHPRFAPVIGRVACALLLALTLASSLAAWLPNAQAGEPVRLQLHWQPQAQFAGYYVALEKGFYEAHGLDVCILPGGTAIHPLERLAQGTVDAATSLLSTALQRHDKGLDLVHIGQIVHDSALMLVARKKDGITTPQDLLGKRVGVWGRDVLAGPLELLARLGIQVRAVRQSPSLDLFMRGGLDAVSAMWYNEYHTLMSYGLSPQDMTAFFLRDLGLNFPEDSLYMLRPTAARPGLAAGLRAGTREGWDYAFAHPDETLDLVLRVMKRSGARANRGHQRWMLARMKDVVLGKRPTVDLSLSCDAYTHTVNTLRTDGIIAHAPPYASFVLQEQP